MLLSDLTKSSLQKPIISQINNLFSGFFPNLMFFLLFSCYDYASIWGKMRKAIIALGICSVFFIVYIISLNQENTPAHSPDYSKIRVKKAKTKKIGKTSKGGFFKSKKLDDKLYALFGKTRKDEKPKMLLFVSEKNGTEKGGKIIIHDQDRDKNYKKPGIIFHDKTDVKTLLKEKETVKTEQIFIQHHTEESILEEKFK